MSLLSDVIASKKIVMCFGDNFVNNWQNEHKTGEIETLVYIKNIRLKY